MYFSWAIKTSVKDDLMYNIYKRGMQTHVCNNYTKIKRFIVFIYFPHPTWCLTNISGNKLNLLM